MDKAYLRSVYRRFWRAGHIAIQDRSPQKPIIREKLRYAFRNETSLPPATAIDNTVQFLLTAGRRRGVENNVIRGLCQVYWRRLDHKQYISLK
jgi:hypothetical protein